MNKFGTMLCCVALLSFGWIMGHKDDTVTRAAPINYSKPMDLQISFYQKVIDSLTKRLEGSVGSSPVSNQTPVVVEKKVPTPVYIYKRDTLYVPLVFIAKLADREEQTVNDNHSTNDSESAVMPNEGEMNNTELIKDLQCDSAHLTN